MEISQILYNKKINHCNEIFYKSETFPSPGNPCLFTKNITSRLHRLQ